MGIIDDAQRGLDAGSRLLKDRPAGKMAATGKAQPAENTKPTKSAPKSGQIDDEQRGLDAGSRLTADQPARKSGATRKKTPLETAKPMKAVPIVYPRADGQRVWAFRAGNFLANKNTGWNECIDFASLKDLLQSLREKKLEGQVATLAIIAHGDKGGVVQLDTLPLTAQTIGTFQTQLAELGSFLKANGKLMFLSCISGQGSAGDALLTSLSKILPGRYIIGFTIFGGFPGRIVASPGQVWEDLYGTGGGTNMPPKPNWLTEYSYFSKWARDEKIIKYPYDDQAKRAKNTCANPTCPGHARAVDQCDVFP